MSNNTRNFPVLPGQPFELRHEVLVIRLGQNPADVNVEKIPAAVFIYLNGHFGLLWSVLRYRVFHFCFRRSAATLVHK